MNMSLKEESWKIVVVVVFLLIVGITGRTFFFVLHKHRQREEIHRRYEDTFLHNGHTCKTGNPPGQWNLRYLGIIVFCYIITCITWMVNEIAGLTSSKLSGSHLAHSITTLVYCVKFLVPSCICIYMSYKEVTRGKDIDCVHRSSLEQNYRMRAYSCTPLTGLSSPMPTDEDLWI